MTLGEIAQALKAPTTDKVGALLAHLLKKSEKALDNAKAAAAEWQVEERLPDGMPT
jgi:hypothetical protein